MQLSRFAITGSVRTHPVAVVGPGDFTLEPSGTIEAEEVLRNPSFSLYCVDPEKDAVIFVECDDPSAIDRAPFYYQAQAEHAKGLVTMPSAVFHEMAERIVFRAEDLVFVHSVGRCGSTLVSKALEAVPSVRSISEPDEFTQMLNLRNAGRYSDRELLNLLHSSVRWRCKPGSGVEPKQVALKFRSEVMLLADLIGSAFATSKHVFLYREGVSWMGSIYKGWPDDRDLYDAESNRKMKAGWSKTVTLVKEYSDVAMNAAEIRMLAWIACMEAYLKMAETGVTICAVRFEDLTARPVEMLTKLFDFCGIEGVDWSSVQEVLGRDSQAGTVFDREERSKRNRVLPNNLIADVRKLVSARPLLGSTDVRVPLTIC